MNKATVMPFVVIGLVVVGCFTIGPWWTAAAYIVAALVLK